MKIINFVDKVFAFTEENALFSAPCHLLVAVSGGPDSMALLHTLLHWPEEGLRLSVVHMNHGLRGQPAERDENFVRQYCIEHNLPLTVFLEDVSSYAKEHSMTLEEAGRVLRYQKFEALRLSLGADYLLTAHTASDQTETILMHLLRGCGLDALLGIPAKRDRICRPLLSCTREEVLSYCDRHHVPFVVDETNEDTRYSRNRIRNDVLPLLKELNPNVDATLLRFQNHLKDDVAFLNESSQNLLQEATKDERIYIEPLKAAAQPIRRRAIRLFLRQHRLETVEEAHICSIEHILLSGKGTTLLPNKLTAQVQNGVLSIIHDDKPNHYETVCFPISDLPVTFSACGKRYTLSLMDYHEHNNVHNLFANHVLDYDTIQGGLMIRTRQMGDTLHPAGRGIGKSLKKLMNEWKIPTEQRDFYPLLCDEAGLLLVPGYACDQRAAVSDTTKRCLIIQSHE